MLYPSRFSQLLLGALLLAPSVYSQVAVVEAGAESRQSAPSTAYGTAKPVARQQATPANATSALFGQIQLLQDEVMQLRGIVEEMQHQLRRLERQRLDDYMSIDKRITELQNSGGAAMPKAPVAAIAPALNAATAAPKASSRSENDAYIAAYQQVKNQDFEQAKKDFLAFLEEFPDGAFAANAHYWLGELYLLEPDLPKASTSFKYLLDNYPKHRKVPDAMFKLAKVYHLEGKNKECKSLLKKVIAEYGDSGSSAVKLAKDYLAKNF